MRADKSSQLRKTTCLTFESAESCLTGLPTIVPESASPGFLTEDTEDTEKNLFVLRGLCESRVGIRRCPIPGKAVSAEGSGLSVVH